jgi:hypothetical protein
VRHRTLILVLVLLKGICPITLLLALSPVNRKPFSDDGYMIVWLVLLPVSGVASGIWLLRHSV